MTIERALRALAGFIVTVTAAEAAMKATLPPAIDRRRPECANE